MRKKHTDRLQRDRSQHGKDQHRGIVKETVGIRSRCISQPEVSFALNPEFANTLGVIYDIVFRECLGQRLVHSIQG